MAEKTLWHLDGLTELDVISVSFAPFGGKGNFAGVGSSSAVSDNY